MKKLCACSPIGSGSGGGELRGKEREGVVCGRMEIQVCLYTHLLPHPGPSWLSGWDIIHYYSYAHHNKLFHVANRFSAFFGQLLPRFLPGLPTPALSLYRL